MMESQVENYRKAIAHLDTCGELTFDKLREVYRIAGVSTPEPELQVMWRLRLDLAPSLDNSGGAEALRHIVRDKLRQAIPVFTSLNESVKPSPSAADHDLTTPDLQRITADIRSLLQPALLEQQVEQAFDAQQRTPTTVDEAVQNVADKLPLILAKKMRMALDELETEIEKWPMLSPEQRTSVRTRLSAPKGGYLDTARRFPDGGIDLSLLAPWDLPRFKACCEKWVSLQGATFGAGQFEDLHEHEQDLERAAAKNRKSVLSKDPAAAPIGPAVTTAGILEFLSLVGIFGVPLMCVWVGLRNNSLGLRLLLSVLAFISSGWFLSVIEQRKERRKQREIIEKGLFRRRLPQDRKNNRS